MKPAKCRQAHYFPLLAAATLLCGCATTHEFTVDAISTADANHRYTSYRITDATPFAYESAAPFARIAGDIKTALSRKGLFEAPPGLPPSMVVAIEYGFNTPRRVTRQESRITYMPATYHPQGATASNPNGSNAMSGLPSPPAGPPLEATRKAIYVTEIVQPKFLRLAAFASSGDGTGKPLWRVEVKNEDRSVDLGNYLRLITAVAMDYIGTNSAAGEPVSMAGNDRRVQFIERGT